MSDNKQNSGLDSDRLQHLKKVIEEDINQGKYYGAAIAVGRHGVLGLHEAIGFNDAKGSKPVTRDTVFSLLSTTKAITNVMVFRAIELGQFALTTKVAEIIPEFSGGLRQHITFTHLLTHSSGLPSVYTPRPGMCIDRLDEVIEAICANVQGTEIPGKRVDYSPMVHHALMGEAISRTDPQQRSYRQLVEEELFKPLEMNSSAIGVHKDLRARHFPPVFIGDSPIEHLGHSDLGPNGAFEEPDSEMPWLGGVSTAGDIYRFAEMLRRGGELDGVRILSPVILQRSRKNHTDEKPNELYKALALSQGWEPFPAYIGLGFSLRGESICHHLYGTLTSPETFGNYGLGSTLFWVDPELDMSFVCLTTGIMDRAPNFERFQRLSDIAVSAAI
jgi:CubicO group peptidase (beta-lactamase class C family)